MEMLEICITVSIRSQRPELSPLVRANPTLNSGVHIRSNRRDTEPVILHDEHMLARTTK